MDIFSKKTLHIVVVILKIWDFLYVVEKMSVAAERERMLNKQLHNDTMYDRFFSLPLKVIFPFSEITFMYTFDVTYLLENAKGWRYDPGGIWGFPAPSFHSVSQSQAKMLGAFVNVNVRWRLYWMPWKFILNGFFNFSVSENSYWRNSRYQSSLEIN